VLWRLLSSNDSLGRIYEGENNKIVLYIKSIWLHAASVSCSQPDRDQAMLKRVVSYEIFVPNDMQFIPPLHN
jgi:hypothetical protein